MTPDSYVAPRLHPTREPSAPPVEAVRWTVTVAVGLATGIGVVKGTDRTAHAVIQEAVLALSGHEVDPMDLWAEIAS